MSHNMLHTFVVTCCSLINLMFYFLLTIVQNFTYTWFCRQVSDSNHATDAEGRLQVHNMQKIPPPISVAGDTGGGCFGSGPGKGHHNITISMK